MSDRIQCEICSKTFTRTHNMRAHMNTHYDIRPFACCVCGRAFGRLHDQRRHEASHFVTKSLACGCGRRFTRPDALKRHLRSVSGRMCMNFNILEKLSSQPLLVPPEPMVATAATSPVWSSGPESVDGDVFDAFSCSSYETWWSAYSGAMYEFNKARDASLPLVPLFIPPQNTIPPFAMDTTMDFDPSLISL